MSNNKNSQYDSPLIIKEVHDFHGQFLRTGDVRSVVPNYFTHFRATYDVLDRPTLVTYFRGTIAHITQVGTTPAAGLGGKYFTLRINPSNSVIAVWFNLDGSSIAPTVPGATLVEVPIMTGDSPELVAMAITLVLNSSQSDNFKSARYGQTVTITSVGLGLVSNSADVDTGFVISNTPGAQEEVAEINIGYNVDDPIYNGQVLKGYAYNIWNGKFEFLSSSTTTISGDVNSLIIGTEDGTLTGTKHVVQIGSDLKVRVLDESSNDKLNDVNINLTNINTALSNPLSIENPVVTAGTIDGSPSGAIYTNVNNIRLQILATHDRIQDITYADFGTKDQRITAIDYTSATFPGITLRKLINYTLVGAFYRRDSIEWTTV